MRAAPHGWTGAPLHTGHKYKGLLGVLAQTQKSTLMARRPPRNPATNNINIVSDLAVPERATCNILRFFFFFFSWRVDE